MPDFVRRGIRSFVWAFFGAILSSGILSAVGTSGVVDWDVVQKVAVSALAAGLTGLIATLMNAMEDKGTIPALLKAPASSGSNPVPPPDSPAVDL